MITIHARLVWVDEDGKEYFREAELSATPHIGHRIQPPGWSGYLLVKGVDHRATSPDETRLPGITVRLG